MVSHTTYDYPNRRRYARQHVWQFDDASLLADALQMERKRLRSQEEIPRSMLEIFLLSVRNLPGNEANLSKWRSPKPQLTSPNQSAVILRPGYFQPEVIG
jgi:hypothetical protein